MTRENYNEFATTLKAGTKKADAVKYDANNYRYTYGDIYDAYEKPSVYKEGGDYMTKQEWRKHDEYKKAWAKIEGYPKGFKWTMEWCEIPKGKANALKILLADCMDAGLIKSVSIGYGIDGKGLVETEEEFIRI